MHYPSGTVVYLEGARGSERVVRKARSNGVVAYFEGGPDEERVVRVEVEGATYHAEGDRGSEHIVRKDVHGEDGETVYYEGRRGEARRAASGR